jgi:hypothetical protein
MGGGYVLAGSAVSTDSISPIDYVSPRGKGDGGWGAVGVQLPTFVSEKLDVRFDLNYALSRSVLSMIDGFGFGFTDGSDLPSGFQPMESIYRLKFDRWELAATGSFVWSPWRYCSLSLGESIGLQRVYNISEEVEYHGVYWDGQTSFVGSPNTSILVRRPSDLENETSLLFGTRIGISSMIPTGKGVRIAPEIDITSSLLSPFTSRAWSEGEIRAGASLLFDADVDH